MPRTKSQIFTEAHRLTRSVMVRGISYQATFGIALQELYKQEKGMNDGHEIVGQYYSDELKDGRTNFFEGKIKVDGLGNVQIKLRVTKSELDRGSMAIVDDRLVSTGVVAGMVEALIENERNRQTAKANETDRLQAAMSHLPAIVGVSEKQAAYATNVRNRQYAELKDRIEEIIQYPHLAVRSGIREAHIGFLPKALAEIETNTDAKFWLDHCGSVQLLVWHLRQQA